MKKKLSDEIKNGDSDSILASLFRTILDDLNIDIKRFDSLLENYITRCKLPKDPKNLSIVRSNKKRELLSLKLSWKVFIKGLMFLNVKKFDIQITLHHANKVKTVHSKSVILTGEDFE